MSSTHVSSYHTDKTPSISAISSNIQIKTGTHNKEDDGKEKKGETNLTFQNTFKIKEWLFGVLTVRRTVKEKTLHCIRGMDVSCLHL